MSKVTSKLQVTIPKTIAEAGRIRPGMEIEFVKAADGIRISIPGAATAPSRLSAKERLALFDAATRRQAARNRVWQRESRKRRTAKRKGARNRRTPSPSFADAAGLVDASILVHRHDHGDPAKQAAAAAFLREGAEKGGIFIPYQALVEFVSAVRKPQKPGGRPLLSVTEALGAVEEMMLEFPVLYPDAETVRTALRIAPAYALSWFDALVLAFADRFGLHTLYSEDFQDGRFYGAVRVQDPFRRTRGPKPHAGGGD